MMLGTSALSPFGLEEFHKFSTYLLGYIYVEQLCEFIWIFGLQCSL